ncbi:LLM class flavin-dependent oxidoreductase [Arthrobacter sp. Cr_A7]|uniref:LLM class flavin-dependent oxidoreductase n=1 Tax=Arthrobacter sp. Cr_A7 TaxID=3031017 RepID=UPI0023DBB8B8|nr:LLM class flavin-dependent oxidoreductase [Arthrobacter sp. Cr_A7]MDF2050424.1 LLM class flavin-dependent oxidoreductase [Arthrobacter sp. Cr_A7]
MANVEFHLFNYGAYPFIPHAKDLPNSAYIDLPNRYFDPIHGNRQLESYLDTLVLGEKLGFDGIHTTTQMGGPIGMTPSANLTAAYLAAKTSRIKIGTLGPILNSFSNPMRAAEEIAMLDQLSGGRLIVGLPMGHGQNYHAAATMNPATARERYWEGHDLIRKAFTDEGPFEWVGKHYHVPYANLWPKPIQKPFPEIWIPAAGSRITLEKAAEFGYVYQGLFVPRKALAKNIATFREATEKFGYKANDSQIALVLFIHVAETDEQARREAEPHLLSLFQNINRSPQHDAFPPGHFSVESLRAALTGGGYRDRDISKLSFEEIEQMGWSVVGSPETVREKLEETIKTLGVGKIIHVADLGSAPNWMIRKSLTLMAEQVIPYFRGADGLPVWAKTELPNSTHTGFGAYALKTPPLVPAQVDMPGVGIVDTQRAHVEELRVPLRVR